MQRKPGGGDNYWLRVLLAGLAIVLMLCYLIYFLYTTGVINGLAH